MTLSMLARDKLWEIASTQHGFVSSTQATELGIQKHALQMLVHRNTLTRAAHGIYRFPQYPTSEFDNLMLAALWPRLPETALSHETALDVYGVSDINPNRIHMTVGKNRRLRRTGGDGYVIHYQDLLETQIGWWNEIPTVTPRTAIEQCISYGTATYLLRQAIDRGHRQGYLSSPDQAALTMVLESRHEK